MENVRLEFGLEDQIELTIQLYLGSSIEYVQNKEEIQCPNFTGEKNSWTWSQRSRFLSQF